MMNCALCPACGKHTLPRLDEGSADAAACQNAECRRVFDRAGVQLGRWTEGYGTFEALIHAE